MVGENSLGDPGLLPTLAVAGLTIREAEEDRGEKVPPPSKQFTCNCYSL